MDLALSSLLQRMKHEFEYWYPFDLRFSGKDLIQNHLTFCIYNHTAVMAKHHWPLGFRCNGHIMLNSQKMSKSTGNFRTLRQTIEEFSADATRFSLADAGDGVDDANFSIDTSNAAIKRLTNEIAWYEQTRLIAPICPHYAEFVWRKILKKDGFVVKAGWPTAQDPDLKLKIANKYLQDSINSMRKSKTKQIGATVGDKEAISFGPQALDLRLSFGEIEVLEENLDLIKREIGLLDAEVLSAKDADSLAKAGPSASLLDKHPPSPGNPTPIFLTK
ncbi:hypothetical protein PIB30_101534 [Stylosanthes scabra]|uniref:Leucine--tRNA ligase n=1 Tax=Stylosanthes scabra TaxID=79078 RepID=A0ABU6TZH0_9FABA|nr:hypothetical protein [Stylosanthes scabra]